jgi:hypothetical protein
MSDVMLHDRNCIFCGNPPAERSREHVIPQWLIEITGEPTREWNLGVQFDEGSGVYRERKFSANQFQFPACDACNGRYSALEGRVKGYILKIGTKEPLRASEWDDLLTWFDKVRIGLWLGMRMLHRELPHLPANFRIDQRIARKDRCLLVYRINPEHKGLIMSGIGDPSFFQWPFCFALTTNALMFINISSDFILAARMGFPFFRKMVDEFPRTYCYEPECFYRQKIPFIRHGFPMPVLEIYQSVLMGADLMGGDNIEDYQRLADHPFIQGLLIPGHPLKSLIHSTQNGEPVRFRPSDLIAERDLPGRAYKHGAEYLKSLFEFRQFVLSDYLNSGRAKQAMENIKAAVVWNLKAIEHMEAELRAHRKSARST